ncbi:hypothetical protein CEXT_405121 [Caerostris extrusa]|uniref:Uncharacterized protein n=1 Tax=Caerostris extrusa TaxID=172846 RepID=A0AAV4MFT3_CAEEX|nr:hypothetical protein CEXT_405121 [Caerostris extrusa]
MPNDLSWWPRKLSDDPKRPTTDLREKASKQIKAFISSPEYFFISHLLWKKYLGCLFCLIYLLWRQMSESCLGRLDILPDISFCDKECVNGV